MLGVVSEILHVFFFFFFLRFYISNELSNQSDAANPQTHTHTHTHRCLFPTSRDSDLIGMKWGLNIWTFNPPGQSLRSTALEEDISKLSDQKTC